MNMLLLLSGYPGNINSIKDTKNLNYNQINFDCFYFGFNYFKKLLKNHKTKVICSIWDNIGLNEVRDLYKPEICSTHNQEDFQKDFENQFKNLEKYRILRREKWFRNYNLKDGSFVPTSRYASQLFIRQEVCRSALKYLKSSEFNPEIIILSRFDIASRGGVPIRNPIEIENNLYSIFERNTKNGFIVIPEFNQLNLGYPDMWYYLNKKALLKMQNLYEVYINSIFQENGSYLNYLQNGWPSSEWFDLKDKYDPRQFSNLTLTGKKIIKNMRYPSWESPNIHMFYKYFISLQGDPLKIYFSKTYLSYLSMFKLLGYKFSIISSINEFIIFLKIKTKIVLKKLKNFSNFKIFD